jgi:hypothetical protein
LASVPGTTSTAGIFNSLRSTCKGQACADITDPRAFVDKVRQLFTAQEASAKAASSRSSRAPPTRAASAHVADAAEWHGCPDGFPPSVHTEPRSFYAPTAWPSHTDHLHHPPAHAEILATHAQRSPHPPSHPPPRRCPRCLGQHAGETCRGRHVPGVGRAMHRSPNTLSTGSSRDPSAPCFMHSSPLRQAQHTNAECRPQSAATPPPKRLRASPHTRSSPHIRSSPSHATRGRAHGSAMVADAHSRHPDEVWQQHPAQGWEEPDGDYQGDLAWPEGQHDLP